MWLFMHFCRTEENCELSAKLAPDIDVSGIRMGCGVRQILVNII